MTCCDLCAEVHADPELREALEPVVRYADKLVEPMHEFACQKSERPEVPRG